MVFFFELHSEKEDLESSEKKEYIESSIPKDIQAVDYYDDVSSITLTGIEE